MEIAKLQLFCTVIKYNSTIPI